MTLPGRDRNLPQVIMGSHLDSVPRGGNFDGAAGVVAGVSILTALKRARFVPQFMVNRAEESAWFDIAYLGSAGAFGLPDPACLSIRRSDNGRSLEATLTERGFNPQAIRKRRRLLDPARIPAYLELHIEQGPTLIARGLPRRGERRSVAAGAFATHAAAANMPIPAPSSAPIGTMPWLRPSPCYTMERIGCSRNAPGPIWR